MEQGREVATPYAVFGELSRLIHTTGCEQTLGQPVPHVGARTVARQRALVQRKRLCAHPGSTILRRQVVERRRIGRRRIQRDGQPEMLLAGGVPPLLEQHLSVKELGAVARRRISDGLSEQRGVVAPDRLPERAA